MATDGGIVNTQAHRAACGHAEDAAALGIGGYGVAADGGTGDG